MRNHGFIAITSAIIISVLLLAIVFTLSLSGFFVRFNILDSEYKTRSEALAEGCVSKVFLNIAQNIALTTTDPSIDCQIVDASLALGQYTIHTKGEFPDAGTFKAITNLEVIVNESDLSVVSWNELPTY